MILEQIKKQYWINKPIFTEDILNMFPDYSRAYVFRLLKKIEEDKELIKFSQGVYYIPRKTSFGLSTITADYVVEKRYIYSDKDVFGIYSGLKLLNQFSVTSQVPNVIEIITNNEATRKREINIDGRKFILRKSRFKIDKNNVNEYRVLQLFSDIKSPEELDVFSKQRLIEYINDKHISKNNLLSLAVKFPTRTIKNLIESGVLNEIAWE